MSALHGDNVVHRSTQSPWYEGSSLLHHLEEVHIASDRNLIDARFPVQYVIRPQNQTDDELHDYRGYAGTVAGGVFKPGDEVVVLPSGFTLHHRRHRRPRRRAGRRGVRADGGHDPPRRRDRHQPGRHDLPRPQPAPRRSGHRRHRLLAHRGGVAPCRGPSTCIKHTTRTAKALVKDLQYRLDVNTLHRDETADALALNEIGRVRLRTQQPLFFDEYRRNRATGSFILIDEVTNATVAAGMMLSPG